MSLVYDRREDLESRPGAHAFLVGVDRYQESPPIAGSVRSAAAVADWLKTHELTAPLATCRMLLSGELENLGNDFSRASPATIENFVRTASKWREDASSHPENIALFFFSGLGFQRSSTDDLLVLSDFGDKAFPVLWGAVAVDNLFQGMAPSPERPDIARTQLYFVDTSRTPAEDRRYQLSRPSLVFDEYVAGPDDRSAVIFYSAEPGKHAFVETGQSSVFTKALLRCLNGEAATVTETSPPRYGITVTSLIRGLRKTMEETTAGLGQRQTAVVGGLVRDQTICYLPDAPLTDVTVVIDNANAASKLTVENRDGEVVYSAEVKTGWTAHFPIPSGFYVFRAREKGGTRKVSTIASVQPGSASVRLVMPS